MPRYFFDMTNAGVVTRDEVGIDLPDDAAARQHAGRLLPDVALDSLRDGVEYVSECDARNEEGLVIYCRSLTYRGDRA